MDAEVFVLLCGHDVLVDEEDGLLDGEVAASVANARLHISSFDLDLLRTFSGSIESNKMTRLAHDPQ